MSYYGPSGARRAAARALYRPYVSQVRKWGRCGVRCGLMDHRPYASTQHPTDHACLVQEVEHPGPHVFLPACGRNLPVEHLPDAAEIGA